MMTVSIRDKTLSYLEDHKVMTLATVGPEGPWAAAVFYASDGFTLYFLSSPRSRHGQNIAVQPNVAATIQEDDQDWTTIKGIQLKGSAIPLQGTERDEAMGHYTRKFPFVSDPAVSVLADALSRITWYKLLPSRLYLIDNSLGFGHRDQIL